MIRDIIWHFKDNEPNYYLDFGEKKTPKRYRDRDLEATSPAQ